jgi:hypothetical protein
MQPLLVGTAGVATAAVAYYLYKLGAAKPPSKDSPATATAANAALETRTKEEVAVSVARPTKDRFVVKNGICAGEFDAVLLSTDLEPDDAIAIQMLAPHLRQVPLLVILGEGPVDKRQMAAEMLAQFGLDKRARIVQGKRSKASWPDGVISCYAGGVTSNAVLVPLGTDDAECEAIARREASDFLQSHKAPFALLLKPPHELLGQPAGVLNRAVGALYGSFNVTCLREQMEARLDASARCTAQEDFLQSFKALLWVERSLSVGRDSTVEPGPSPEIWAHFEASPSIVQHVLQWNADTLKAMGKKLASLDAEVRKSLSGGDGAGGLTASQYGSAAEAVSKAEKRVKVMSSITRSFGRQVCHADTLVAACLLDGGGHVARFEQKSMVRHDSNSKPIFTHDETSSIATLVASDGVQRQQLEANSLAVMLAAYGLGNA